MAAESDEHLVSAFLSDRSEQVFRALYKKHTPRLYLFALRLCAGNSSRADDVVQETWIKAVQNLSKFEWRSQLSSWLSGIALNCYRDSRSKWEATHLHTEQTALASGMDTSLDLEACIRRLPERCREIFILHDIEGYTHEEIGRLLNIRNGTSKSQLFEARQKLRSWLSKSKKEEVK